MGKGLPPNPAQYRDPKQWMQQMYDYLVAETRVDQDNDPLPVLLPHRVTGAMERAGQSGIVMYDPVAKSVVYSENNIWRPITMDPGIFQAEAVVLSTYGDTVSVATKAKNLNKFGTNSTVGTTFETVAQFQGTTANETFVSTNLIDSVVSSSTSDTTQTIRVEGHTIDGSGNLTFVIQDAILTGQTEVTLATPLARCTRMSVKASGTFNTTPAALVGVVSAYDNTDGIASGVPSTAAATKCLIEAGETQSQKCGTSISSTDYWFITTIDAGLGVAGGNAARVLVRVEVRDVANGGSWLPLGRDLTLEVSQNGIQQQDNPLLIVPKNHDVRVRAKTDANTASVFAELRGYLAEVQQ